jgi:hypothetical protein
MRPIPDREISPELAEAVDAFRDAMAVCRANAIDDGPMTPKSRRQAWAVDDYAIAGVRQFLDIGTGLPTMQNTHEVAQAVVPDSKIVYVDNDPIALALLPNTTDEGVTAYVDTDLRHPDLIIATPATY